MPSAFVPYQRYQDDTFFDAHATVATESSSSELQSHSHPHSHQSEEDEDLHTNDLDIDLLRVEHYFDARMVVSPPQVKRKVHASVFAVSMSSMWPDGSSKKKNHLYVPLEDAVEVFAVVDEKEDGQRHECTTTPTVVAAGVNHDDDDLESDCKLEDVVAERNGLREENDKLRRRLYETNSTIRKMSLLMKNNGTGKDGLELVRTASSTDTEDCEYQQLYRKENKQSFDGRRKHSFERHNIESLDQHHRISPDALVDMLSDKCYVTAVNDKVGLNESIPQFPSVSRLNDSIPQFQPSLIHQLPHILDKGTHDMHNSQFDENESSDDLDDYFEEPLHGTDFLSDEPLRGSDFATVEHDSFLYAEEFNVDDTPNDKGTDFTSHDENYAPPNRFNRRKMI